jgi:hypothetical protein
MRFSLDYTLESSLSFFFRSISRSKEDDELSKPRSLRTLSTEDYPNDSFEYIYILSVNLMALCSLKIQGASGRR